VEEQAGYEVGHDVVKDVVVEAGQGKTEQRERRKGQQERV
jgi:hypothetical protein